MESNHEKRKSFEEEIVDFYKNDNSMKKTGENFGISPYRVKTILLKNNIKPRTRKEQLSIENKRRRSYVNDNYFDEMGINQCYLLGFIAADGNVSKINNKIKIALSSIDKDFLIKVRNELEVENEIRDEETNKGFKVSTLFFSSEKIKNRLAYFGIVPNKTYKKSLKFENIPDKNKIYFIKGYFDGDGSFDPKNGRVRISAHYDYILEDFKHYFNKIGIKGNIYSYNKEKSSLYSLEYSTLPGLSIMELFYKDTDIQLDRKYQKYISLLEKRNHETSASNKVDEKVC